MSASAASPAPISVADPAGEYRAAQAEIDAAVARVLASGRFILGPEGAALEETLARQVGVPHAVAVNSGTDALHLALRAAEVGPGDEVIVPGFTFVATAEAVSYCGAKPVFADVDPDTFCLTPREVEAKLTPRTRAVIPVHLYGQTAPIAQIAAICRERGLTLVEDCAQSLGADDHGRKAGAWGDFGCFSFYPTKNLAAAGDAGLVTARDEKMAERLRMLRHHGSRKTYVHEILGYNSRLDEIQAAILNVKLGHLERFNDAREAVARGYLRGLEGLPVKLPVEHRRGRHVWNQFTLVLEGRDRVREALAQAQVASMVYYPTPLHRLPLYAEAYRDVHLPVSEELSRKVLSLPIHPLLTAADVARVCEALRAAL